MNILKKILFIVPTMMLLLAFSDVWANEGENYQHSNNYPRISVSPTVTKSPSPTKIPSQVSCDDLVATPESGYAPLTVNFTIQQTGADEARMRYGQFNLGFNWVYLGNTFIGQYTYTNPGIYTPHAQVKKANSNNWVGPEPHCKAIIEVKKPKLTPTVTISVTPTITITPSITLTPTITVTPTPYDEEVTPTPYDEEITPTPYDEEETPTPTVSQTPAPTDKPADNNNGGGTGGGTGGGNVQSEVQGAVLGATTLAQTGSMEENVINISFAVSFLIFGLLVRNRFSQA